MKAPVVVTNGQPDFAPAGSDFAGIFRLYYARCLQVALKVTRDHHHAQDAVQEAFLSFARSPERFDRTKGQLGTWLSVLTHRRAVDLVRREQSRPRPAPTPDTVTARLQAARNPEDEAEQLLLSDRVRALVRNLDDPRRQVIVMSYYLGYTQAEIAAATGIPLGTVRARTRDALRQLRVTAGSGPGWGQGEGVAAAA